MNKRGCFFLFFFEENLGSFELKNNYIVKKKKIVLNIKIN
jgi:hypothetical protein